MIPVYLLLKHQNTVGLEVEFDLDQPEPLQSAYELTKADELTPHLCYYSAAAEPLIEWLMLLCEFKVVVDKEQVLTSPLPRRLQIEEIPYGDVISLFNAQQQEDAEQIEDAKSEKYSDLPEEAEDDVS